MREGSPEFVAPAERVAVFDNDGTLWAEQPLYSQFLRVFAEKVYRVPPGQAIGSSGKTKYELRDGKPVLVKQPKLYFFDDGAGKSLAIQHYIGRRPIAAFGNSDGDLEMLQWTAAGSGPRFCLYVHHTDSEREWEYGRTSSVGKLDAGLDEATARGWTVVSIKDDWRTVFSPPIR